MEDVFDANPVVDAKPLLHTIGSHIGNALGLQTIYNQGPATLNTPPSPTVQTGFSSAVPPPTPPPTFSPYGHPFSSFNSNPGSVHLPATSQVGPLPDVGKVLQLFHEEDGQRHLATRRKLNSIFREGYGGKVAFGEIAVPHNFDAFQHLQSFNLPQDQHDDIQAKLESDLADGQGGIQSDPMLHMVSALKHIHNMFGNDPSQYQGVSVALPRPKDWTEAYNLQTAASNHPNMSQFGHISPLYRRMVNVYKHLDTGNVPFMVEQPNEYTSRGLFDIAQTHIHGNRLPLGLIHPSTTVQLGAPTPQGTTPNPQSPQSPQSPQTQTPQTQTQQAPVSQTQNPPVIFPVPRPGSKIPPSGNKPSHKGITPPTPPPPASGQGAPLPVAPTPSSGQGITPATPSQVNLSQGGYPLPGSKGAQLPSSWFSRAQGASNINFSNAGSNTQPLAKHSSGQGQLQLPLNLPMQPAGPTPVNHNGQLAFPFGGPTSVQPPAPFVHDPNQLGFNFENEDPDSQLGFNFGSEDDPEDQVIPPPSTSLVHTGSQNPTYHVDIPPIDYDLGANGEGEGEGEGEGLGTQSSGNNQGPASHIDIGDHDGDIGDNSGLSPEDKTKYDHIVAQLGGEDAIRNMSNRQYLSRLSSFGIGALNPVNSAIGKLRQK